MKSIFFLIGFFSFSLYGFPLKTSGRILSENEENFLKECVREKFCYKEKGQYFISSDEYESFESWIDDRYLFLSELFGFSEWVPWTPYEDEFFLFDYDLKLPLLRKKTFLEKIATVASGEMASNKFLFLADGYLKWLPIAPYLAVDFPEGLFFQTDIDVPIEMDGIFSKEIPNLVFHHVDIQKNFDLDENKFDFIYMRNGTCICFPEEEGESCSSLGPLMKEYRDFIGRVVNSLNLKNKESEALFLHRNWGNPDHSEQYYGNTLFWSFLEKEMESIYPFIDISILHFDHLYAGLRIKVRS